MGYPDQYETGSCLEYGYGRRGGPDAEFVWIPTAGDSEPKVDPATSFLGKAGVKHITVLHTRGPKVADTEAFVRPLRTAKAIWFVDGRQWRLADSYLNTRTQSSGSRC